MESSLEGIPKHPFVRPGKISKHKSAPGAPVSRLRHARPYVISRFNVKSPGRAQVSDKFAVLYQGGVADTVRRDEDEVALDDLANLVNTDRRNGGEGTEDATVS